jgi:hypothetical protein
MSGRGRAGRNSSNKPSSTSWTESALNYLNDSWLGRSTAGRFIKGTFRRCCQSREHHDYETKQQVYRSPRRQRRRRARSASSAGAGLGAGSSSSPIRRNRTLAEAAREAQPSDALMASRTVTSKGVTSERVYSHAIAKATGVISGIVTLFVFYYAAKTVQNNKTISDDSINDYINSVVTKKNLIAIFGKLVDTLGNLDEVIIQLKDQVKAQLTSEANRQRVIQAIINLKLINSAKSFITTIKNAGTAINIAAGLDAAFSLVLCPRRQALLAKAGAKRWSSYYIATVEGLAPATLMTLFAGFLNAGAGFVDDFIAQRGFAPSYPEAANASTAFLAEHCGKTQFGTSGLPGMEVFDCPTDSLAILNPLTSLLGAFAISALDALLVLAGVFAAAYALKEIVKTFAGALDNRKAITRLSHLLNLAIIAFTGFYCLSATRSGADFVQSNNSTQLVGNFLEKRALSLQNIKAQFTAIELSNDGGAAAIRRVNEEFYQLGLAGPQFQRRLAAAAANAPYLDQQAEVISSAYTITRVFIAIVAIKALLALVQAKSHAAKLFKYGYQRLTKLITGIELAVPMSIGTMLLLFIRGNAGAANSQAALTGLAPTNGTSTALLIQSCLNFTVPPSRSPIVKPLVCMVERVSEINPLQGLLSEFPTGLAIFLGVTGIIIGLIHLFKELVLKSSHNNSHKTAQRRAPYPESPITRFSRILAADPRATQLLHNMLSTAVNSTTSRRHAEQASTAPHLRQRPPGADNTDRARQQAALAHEAATVAQGRGAGTRQPTRRITNAELTGIQVQLFTPPAQGQANLRPVDGDAVVNSQDPHRAARIARAGGQVSSATGATNNSFTLYVEASSDSDDSATAPRPTT